MPRAARPQPGYAPENKPRAASTSSASSIRTRRNVLDKPRYTITVYNLTFGDQSRNAEAARIYAGMTIRERRTTSNYSEIVAHELFHWFKQLPHMIFGATNARFCCVPSGLIGNAQWRDAGNVVRHRSYIFTSRRHDNVLPAKACCGPRNRSRRDQAGTQQQA